MLLKGTQGKLLAAVCGYYNGVAACVRVIVTGSRDWLEHTWKEQESQRGSRASVLVRGP